MIEDLYSRDTPESLDFGAGGEYKKQFGNDSYQEADLFLFRRRPYPLAVAALQRSCHLAARVADTTLGPLHLKEPIRRLLMTVRRARTSAR